MMARIKKTMLAALPETKDNPSALRVQQLPAETRAEALAHASLRPTVQAAVTLMGCNKGIGELSVNTLVSDLDRQCERASSGDLTQLEAILIAQAHTLDAIFNSLARRSVPNMGEHTAAAEVYMRLALKAQSQCRTTVEALAMIKNPAPVAFVKQANIGQAVQVNNGVEAPKLASRANSAQESANKVLEQVHGERMDPGASGKASRVDSRMETVDARHRPSNQRRQSTRSAESS